MTSHVLKYRLKNRHIFKVIALFAKATSEKNVQMENWLWLPLQYMNLGGFYYYN